MTSHVFLELADKNKQAFSPRNGWGHAMAFVRIPIVAVILQEKIVHSPRTASRHAVVSIFGGDSQRLR